MSINNCPNIDRNVPIRYNKEKDRGEQYEEEKYP